VEIVLRAGFVFAFLWFVTRAVGKRELGQLNTFELLLLITMGDLVQQGVTQEDYSVTGAVLAVGTFAVLSVVLSYVSWRWRRSRDLIEGIPVVVARNGEMLIDVMRYERLPADELLEAMRQEGIRDIADVEVAVLEPNGRYSFFRRPEGGSRAPSGSG
jgi:uncharacterized membrane protein YcaP (DUF421 family)